MIKQSILIILIYFTSYIYNLTIYPIIITYINHNFYNNIIISLLILIQIDNFTLFYDLSKKNENLNNRSRIEDKYINIILKQIEYINKEKRELLYITKRKTKSYNDIFYL